MHIDLDLARPVETIVLIRTPRGPGGAVLHRRGLWLRVENPLEALAKIQLPHLDYRLPAHLHALQTHILMTTLVLCLAPSARLAIDHLRRGMVSMLDPTHLTTSLHIPRTRGLQPCQKKRQLMAQPTHVHKVTTVNVVFQLVRQTPSERLISQAQSVNPLLYLCLPTIVSETRTNHLRQDILGGVDSEGGEGYLTFGGIIWLATLDHLLRLAVVPLPAGEGRRRTGEEDNLENHTIATSIMIRVGSPLQELSLMRLVVVAEAARHLQHLELRDSTPLYRI